MAYPLFCGRVANPPVGCHGGQHASRVICWHSRD